MVTFANARVECGALGLGGGVREAARGEPQAPRELGAREPAR